MGSQRLFDIGLAEREPGLPQIFGVGAQHGNLAPVEAGGQHQTVEIVAFSGAGENLPEGILEDAAHAFDVEFFGTLVVQAEIVQPDSWAVGPGDFVGALLNDPDAHVFEHGQRGG